MVPRTLWDELNDFRRSFDQVFENFASTTRRQSSGGERDYNFSPAVETGWSDDYLNLRVIVPGVSQNDIRVSVQANQLVIEGERKFPEEFGKQGNVYNHMNYGKFQRVLDLPGGLELDKLQANLHDGVLDIRVPVAHAMKPRQVQVTGGSGETKIDAKGETKKTIAA